MSRFACACGCGFDSPDPLLVDVIAKLEEAAGVPAWVSSGCRCPARNESVGASRNSYHLNGMAADISVPGWPPSQVYDWLAARYAGALGLIEYRDFVHVDTRGMRTPYHRPRDRGDLS